ncbi:LexA family protein [Saccharicrinis sp. FJH54]|uniref:LexA family protein n=1 Tax=Saccharicrinis sp. FJH54 TaxID=3344665 RepID=UPI0035D44291
MKVRKFGRGKELEMFSAAVDTHLERQLAAGGIKAGFPSPAEDFLDIAIDLNVELIRNPVSTFFSRVSGNSMQDMGINDGDLLIVDKSLQPENNKVAVCYLDGEFTLKRIKIEKDCCWLIPANEDFKPIKVTAENDFIVWGIVTYVIKSL